MQWLRHWIRFELKARVNLSLSHSKLLTVYRLLVGIGKGLLVSTTLGQSPHVRHDGHGEGVFTQIGSWVWEFGRTKQGEPQSVAFDGVAILVWGCQGHTVACLAQVGQHVGTDFKFGLVEQSVSVCWPLDQAELGTIDGMWRVHIDGQGD